MDVANNRAVSECRTSAVAVFFGHLEKSPSRQYIKPQGKYANFALLHLQPA
jgi:hypothetical protein